jgi:hypothetical protein
MGEEIEREAKGIEGAPPMYDVDESNRADEGRDWEKAATGRERAADIRRGNVQTMTVGFTRAILYDLDSARVD